MNRKIMILMVAVVATVLPAVAVADVMITGSVQASGQAIPDAFIVQPGSNYGSANSMAGFTWTSTQTSEAELLGTFGFGYMTNETITEVNVLDINFTSSGTFNITAGIPYPSDYAGTPEFPFGNGFAYLYTSNSSLSISPSGTVYAAITSMNPSGSYTTLDLNSYGSYFESFTVNSGTTIYLGFMLGPVLPSDVSFSLGMSLYN